MTADVEALIRSIQQLPLPEKEHVLVSVLRSVPDEAEIQSLADLQAQYPGEWLATTIPEGEDRCDPQRGQLVAHSPDRSLVWQHVLRLPANQEVYVFFNGPIAVKAFGITFHDTADHPVAATLGG